MSVCLYGAFGQHSAQERVGEEAVQPDLIQATTLDLFLLSDQEVALLATTSPDNEITTCSNENLISSIACRTSLSSPAFIVHSYFSLPILSSSPASVYRAILHRESFLKKPKPSQRPRGTAQCAADGNVDEDNRVSRCSFLPSFLPSLISFQSS